MEISITIGQIISKNSSKDTISPKFTAYKKDKKKKTFDFPSENNECYDAPFTFGEF